MTCACAAIARPGGALPFDLRRELSRHEAALDAFCFASSRLLFAGGMIFCGLLALVRNEGNPIAATRDSIARDMTIALGIVDAYGPAVRRLTGVDPTALRNTLASIRAWATGATTTGTHMPTIAAGSITSKAGSARSFVPVPMRAVSAANQIAGSVHGASKYASLLLDAMQTTRSVRGMTDFRVALVEQAAAEHQAIRAFADKAADVFRVSPRLLTLKAAAQGGALAYLKQVYSNQTPGPWSFDDAVAILNDPGVVIRRDVRDRGPVTGPMPGTSPAPFPTSPPSSSSSSSSIGIAIGALGGFAIGGPMGAVVGAAIGAAVGGDGG